jgi:hypothetical protein
MAGASKLGTTKWYMISPLTFLTLGLNSIKQLQTQGLGKVVMFHQNPPKGFGEVAKTKYFSQKKLSPGL